MWTFEGNGEDDSRMEKKGSPSLVFSFSQVEIPGALAPLLRGVVGDLLFKEKSCQGNCFQGWCF